MEICWWVDTNGVPAMVESRSGFQKKSYLLFHMSVCWLSKRNVLKRVCVIWMMKDEIKIFS